MPVRFKHDIQSHSVFFITFKCYRWKKLFSITDTYDAVYKWFDSLHQNNLRVLGYVIMPNHLHACVCPGVLRWGSFRIKEWWGQTPGYDLMIKFINAGSVQTWHSITLGLLHHIYIWKDLFSITDTYDAVYKWFDSLHQNKHRVLGYVIIQPFSCFDLFPWNEEVVEQHRW